GATAPQPLTPDVLADVVGAQEVRLARRQQWRSAGERRIVRRQHRREDSTDAEHSEDADPHAARAERPPRLNADAQALDTPARSENWPAARPGSPAEKLPGGLGNRGTG